MKILPKSSSGIVLAQSGDLAIVYDLVCEVVHHLNSTAALLLAACDGESPFDEVVDNWTALSHADPDRVANDVEAGIARLTELGLIGRTEDPTLLAPRVGSKAELVDPVMGAVHAVLDHGLVFRGNDRQLLDEIDTYLGTADEHRAVDLFFDVVTRPDGGVTLTTDDMWDFPSREAMLHQVVGAVNEYAARTRNCIALHSAAVRSPVGEVVVLPGTSGSGKSTLAGALVAAGWDYLGDEAIGVRPITLSAISFPKCLTLDAVSRRVLGLPAGHAPDVAVEELRPDAVRLFGDVGPIDQILLPTFVEGAVATFDRLTPADAIDALLANSLNLGGAGESGFQALCDLAATVPVTRLTHGDSREVARLIGETGITRLSR